jgi:hypothetical protein
MLRLSKIIKCSSNAIIIVKVWKRPTQLAALIRCFDIRTAELIFWTAKNKLRRQISVLYSSGTRPSKGITIKQAKITIKTHVYEGMIRAMNRNRGNRYEIEDAPITLVIIMMNVIRVIIRLCSPLPAAPVKLESTTAIIKLDTAIKKREKKVDRMLLNIFYEFNA